MLGAFAAHGLQDKLESSQLQAFETGVRYQMYHALMLFAVAWLMDRSGHILLNSAGMLFIIGIILFSGSLYLLATRNLLGLDSWTWLGPVTPMGGLAFIIGWLLLFIGILKSTTVGADATCAGAPPTRPRQPERSATDERLLDHRTWDSRLGDQPGRVARGVWV